MTTATIQTGLAVALAEIPQAHRRVYVAGLVLDLLLAFVVLSVVWGL